MLPVIPNRISRLSVMFQGSCPLFPVGALVAPSPGWKSGGHELSTMGSHALLATQHALRGGKAMDEDFSRPRGSACASLQSITIGPNTIEDLDIRKIDVSGISLRRFESHAFEKHDGLFEILVPASLVEIGANCFSGSGLRRLDLSTTSEVEGKHMHCVVPHFWKKYYSLRR
jgi:hypothetical protein